MLDELAVYAGNVHLQDSLLTLSKMTPEEQKEVCRKIVDDLIKREKEAEEAAKKEAYLAEQQGKTGPIDKNAPSNPALSMNTDKSWYFYNTMTRNAGKTEFQRRWGARKLEDDWRRRNKATFSLDDEPEADDMIAGNDSISSDEKDKTGNAADANDPHNVEFYLRQIPSTPQEILTANDVIQEGLYNMGVILKDKLEDFPAARDEFSRLLSRYPDNIYRLDIYYNMYLMAVRDNNEAACRDLATEDSCGFPRKRIWNGDARSQLFQQSEAYA